MAKGCRRRLKSCAAGVLLLAAGFLVSCATPALDAARYQFYAGQVALAEQRLVNARVPEVDRVLLLMERGMIRQANRRYEESTRDFIAAADLLEQLETYSLSKGAASLVVNDGTQDFRGTPYERTFLHVFTAINHLLLQRWDDAGVEARRIIKSLDPSRRGDYPEDAFSRYIAGFCLELISDDSNAALQYRLANKLLSDIVVNPRTGHILRKTDETNVNDDTYEIPGDKPWQRELVCFVFLGRSPTGREAWDPKQNRGNSMYADILQDGKLLGRSHNLADTAELAFTTAQLEAVRKATKTVARVVLKEAIASAVEKQTDNAALGELVRLTLIGMLETPDLRRWETLPRWLQVARVPLNEDTKNLQVIFRNAAGVAIGSYPLVEVTKADQRIFISVARDIYWK